MTDLSPEVDSMVRRYLDLATQAFRMLYLQRDHGLEDSEPDADSILVSREQREAADKAQKLAVKLAGDHGLDVRPLALEARRIAAKGTGGSA